jgi:putative sterol carrier protein
LRFSFCETSQAFLNKKLRIKGDMGLAMKLGQLIGPNAKL